VYLDGDPDWDELGNLLRDGWRMIAPKKLVKATDGQSSAVRTPQRRVPRKHR
jgi:hypothetical protein